MSRIVDRPGWAWEERAPVTPARGTGWAWEERARLLRLEGHLGPGRAKDGGNIRVPLLTGHFGSLEGTGQLLEVHVPAPSTNVRTQKFLNVSKGPHIRLGRKGKAGGGVGGVYCVARSVLVRLRHRWDPYSSLRPSTGPQ